jgi:phage tail protein X
MKLTIRTKLLLAFSLILILSNAVNIYGIFQMERLADLTTKIYNHPLQVTRAVLTANAGIINMRSSMKDIALAKSEADIKAAHSQIEQYEQAVYEQLNIVQKWILGKEGATLITETIQTFGDWFPIREEVIALKKAEKGETIFAITKETRHIAMLNEQMEALKNYAASKASGMYEDAKKTRTNVITATIIALVVVFILSALLGVFLSLGIANSIQIINIIANKMVAGEITSIVKNRAEVNKVIVSGDEIGEIGRAFYAVAIYFNTVIDDIVQVSQGLAKGNLRIMPKADYQGDFIQIKNALETALPSQR